MKKYRKRVVPNYEEKYNDYQFEFYGVFIKKNEDKIVEVKVDPKRLRKTKVIDNDVYNKIQSINRNTPYFYPMKKINEKYNYDIFSRKINGLKRLWNQEIKPAIEKLKTPEQVGQDAFLGAISDGVMEYDECEMVKRYKTMKRAEPYSYAVIMFYAQFILLFGSTVEAVMVEVITKNGYIGEKFNREYLKGYVSGHVSGLDYTSFEYHSSYDKLYKLWNFLKHNNIDVYTKLRQSYPELLINSKEGYKNGDLAIKYLLLSEELIMELLDGVLLFFKEFCEKVFSETTDYEEWNTETFYVTIVNDWIEMVNNPLGLPWYI